MRKFLLLLLGAILLSLLAFFCFNNKASFIKNDLESKANKLYENENMNWVDAKLRGEEKSLTTIMTLTGTAPDADAKLKAAKIAKKINGISYVDNQLILENSVQNESNETSLDQDISTKKEDQTEKIKEEEITTDSDQSTNEQTMKVPTKEIEDINNTKKESLVDLNITTDEDKEEQSKESSKRKELNKIATAKETEVLKPNDNQEDIQENMIEKRKTILKTDNIKYSKQECQEKFNELLSNNKITFSYDKADIKQESYTTLDKLVLTTKRCGKIAIMISGHTDSDGNEIYNRVLSQKRANAVKQYMVKNGIKDKYLLAVGYGELKPIATNKTEEGKAKNRRIEFSIEGKR
jgi:outer membrane protein OmpA-like peptidoglycan-associated protein